MVTMVMALHGAKAMIKVSFWVRIRQCKGWQCRQSLDLGYRSAPPPAAAPGSRCGTHHCSTCSAADASCRRRPSTRSTRSKGRMACVCRTGIRVHIADKMLLTQSVEVSCYC